MSIEFQKAYEADNAVLRDDNSVEYVDAIEDNFVAETGNYEVVEESEQQTIDAETGEVK